MVQGVGGNNAAIQAVDSPLVGGGAVSEGNVLSNQKDSKEAATDAKFGDVWKNIQAKYGAKPEKPREIKKTLGKDDFLKIMITQMKHQDPTQPFKAEQFASEMAQFTSVEQMQNMNRTLEKMTTQNQPLERLAMTNMIGKTVTVDKERFPHTEGSATPLGFNLPKDAETVQVSIVSDKGEVVHQKDLGELKAGEHSFSWDGAMPNTLPAKSGTYIFRVDARDHKDQAIPLSTKAQQRVVGVSFEGTEAVFLVGDLKNPEKITMRNIVRIDGDANAMSNMIPGAQSLAQASAPAGVQAAQAAAPAQSAAPAANTPNFFTWQKGIGSANVSAEQLSPEAQRAISNFSAEKAAKNEEKGFPNGLSENNDDTLSKGGESR